jgi:hypothetical protein
MIMCSGDPPCSIPNLAILCFSSVLGAVFLLQILTLQHTLEVAKKHLCHASAKDWFVQVGISIGAAENKDVRNTNN